MKHAKQAPQAQAPVPPEMVELIRPYLEGELAADEAAMVEQFARDNPAFKQQLESRQWLLKKMQGVYGPRAVSRDFQEVADEKLKYTTSQRAVEVTVPEGEDELPAAAPAGFFDTLSARMGAAPWWIVSGAFHALLLLLLTLVGMALLRAKGDEVVIVTDLMKQKEPEEQQEIKKRDIFKKPVEFNAQEVVTEQVVVTHEEVEVAEVAETPDESDANNARGEEGLSDAFLGGTGVVASLGLGGGGAGAFGRPNSSGGRLRRAMQGGGGKATESAVDKALEWLARHQEADGRWSVRQTEGDGDWDPGVTGLATLAFLGAGHTEKVGKYKGNVQAAIKWMIGQQRDDGAIGTDKKFEEHHGGYGYHHAICGMALAEASAMGRVPETKAAAQKAIDYTCNEYQCGDQSDKLGWRYKPKAAVGDLSVSGWYIMQLKSAKVAGLHVDPASFEGAIKFLDSRMQDPGKVKKVDDAYDNGQHRYGYTERGAMYNTTSIGILCRLYTGSKPEEVQGAAMWLLKEQPPQWDGKLGQANGGGWPMYYMYYTTLTLFQTGGEMWKEWNDKLKGVLCTNQRKDGDFDGSWDPLSPWEKRAGRAYTTALGAMCLEVYYRYMPLYR
ncbi:MAG: terpene cyclase/mutase family protein [Planctomycetota bacterium]|nr:terpene cyclase/mutase family protein [Planctomycetota bacterium]